MRSEGRHDCVSPMSLVACQFNQVRTAEQLGISRQGLIKKINRYHIRVKNLRDEVYESL